MLAKFDKLALASKGGPEIPTARVDRMPFTSTLPHDGQIYLNVGTANEGACISVLKVRDNNEVVYQYFL